MWTENLRIVFVLGFLLGGVPAAALERMSDEEMSRVSGREFFVADYIDGTQASPPNTDFGFYRLMLNANLEMNANIEHLQMGCGGINDNLDPSLCDIDMEHLRIMGRGTTPETGSQAGEEGSLFELRRPYVEFAVRNDQQKTQREVVGIKIGAEQADGYMGVGRYNPDAQGCTQANEGDGAAACHSGLNSISGFLRTEMAASIDTELGWTCFGNTAFDDDSCGQDQKFITNFVGTRMENITLLNKALETSLCLPGFLGGGCIEGFSDIKQDLSMIHGFAFEETSDFFMSFQRERVAWPDFVEPGATQTYAASANTGWWFNVPYTSVRGAQGEVSLGFTGLFEALGEGVNVVDAELGQRPPDNCFGSPEFC